MPGMPGMPGMLGMPGMPGMPTLTPSLKVRVDGLKFDYQLTVDDVRKVFARYGEVRNVILDTDGTSATVELEQQHQVVHAQQDLDNKQLSGMSGAFLRVEFASPQTYDLALSQMMAAVAAQNALSGNPMMPPPPAPGPPWLATPPSPPGPGSNRPKKNTCKLEVGIENEGEFRVGSRVIQIARQIWQDSEFQRLGGKTRLRGKGCGGPHEADEPLALCISCADQSAFNKAVAYAESQLQKVHDDYRSFCELSGKPVPELNMKVSKKGSGRGDPGLGPNAEMPRGEKPPNAPTDQEIEQLIEERNEARKSLNFAKADEVREYLKQRGVVLMDEKAAKGNLRGKEVTKWRYWRA
mmetsp:Transcript_80713/g.224649  ORF Transcript_80713/g.224649 Transcript_80713/m.224649 type:complete len:352 (+) Transcript_80713:2-1057(+)